MDTATDSFLEDLVTRVTPQHFSELKSACQLILSQYPAEDYCFLGLGRSPSPIIAGLNQLAQEQIAFSIPISIRGYTWDSLKPSEHRETLMELHKKYVRHIPADKGLVMIDWVETGLSLCMGGMLLQQIIGATRYVTLALCKTEPEDRLFQNQYFADSDSSMAALYSTSFSHLLTQMAEEAFKKEPVISAVPNFRLYSKHTKVSDLPSEPTREWQGYLSLLKGHFNRPTKQDDSIFTLKKY